MKNNFIKQHLGQDLYGVPGMEPTKEELGRRIYLLTEILSTLVDYVGKSRGVDIEFLRSGPKGVGVFEIREVPTADLEAVHRAIANMGKEP